MLNQILFGAIGFFMFAITGIGIAEVGTQMRAQERLAENVSIDTETEADVSVQGTSQEDGVVKKAVYTITDVVTTVVDATTGVMVGVPRGDTEMRSRDSDDDEWEDEEEGGDEEEDEDDRRSGASKQTTSVSGAAGAQTTTSIQSFTLAQIAAHSTALDCYSAINGSVYDLTPFVNQHPGGAGAIKSLCGVDGSSAYNGQHGGASRPANELASLKIGVLVR